jgi:23S rRNA (uracil1939-C5)-methyltransferase
VSQIDIEIEKLVYGGEGLARLDGRTVLVPFTLPGEKLTADIVREKGRLVRAKPSSFEQKSTERIDATCPVFTSCGGCNYQHIPYEKQLDYKEAILRETLARIGKIEWDGEIERIASEPFGYRNRTQLRVVKRGSKADIGFLQAGSHNLVPTDSCPINSPKLNEIHAALLRMSTDRRFPGILKEVEFFTNETDVQLNVIASDLPLAKNFFDWAAENIPGLLPGAHLEYPCGEDVFRVGSRSFFQVNRFLAESLATSAIEGASGSTALDLYCGVGLITLPLARKFDTVIGVDSSPAAMRSLQFNAERADVKIKSVHLNVDQYLGNIEDAVDFVVADPPRAGLGEDVTRELIRIAPKQLNIVSCDPSTLARDLRKLLDGGYQIDSCTLIDLFPQTYHLETIVRLTRK